MSTDTEVDVRVNGDVSILDIRGDVTAGSGPPIQGAYQKVSAAGAQKILVCFDRASYINSGGIGILIGIVSETKKRGQTLRMTGLSAHFQKIFAMVGLTKYAKLFGTEEAALADF
jgi:anti-anti-sigma factor